MSDTNRQTQVAGIDAFNKYFAQAKAHVNVLAADDQFSFLAGEDVAAIL